MSAVGIIVLSRAVVIKITVLFALFVSSSHQC